MGLLLLPVRKHDESNVIWQKWLPVAHGERDTLGPTGRDEFPSFIARSRSNPASVTVDRAAWRALWQQTETWLQAQDVFEKSHRWSGDAEVCA